MISSRRQDRNGLLQVFNKLVKVRPRVLACFFYYNHYESKFKLLVEMQFVGQSGNSDSVIPYSPDNDMGISPMEVLHLGLGGSNSSEVVSILKNTSKD